MRISPEQYSPAAVTVGSSSERTGLRGDTAVEADTRGCRAALSSNAAAPRGLVKTAFMSEMLLGVRKVTAMVSFGCPTGRSEFKSSVRAAGDLAAPCEQHAADRQHGTAWSRGRTGCCQGRVATTRATPRRS